MENRRVLTANTKRSTMHASKVSRQNSDVIRRAHFLAN